MRPLAESWSDDERSEDERFDGDQCAARNTLDVGVRSKYDGVEVRGGSTGWKCGVEVRYELAVMLGVFGLVNSTKVGTWYLNYRVVLILE